MIGYNYFQTIREMNFTIYSKEDCPYCYKIKTVLDLTGSNYVEYTLGKQFTRKEFYEEFGEGSTFPQVLCDDKKIGGCIDTIKFLREHQLVKS